MKKRNTGLKMWPWKCVGGVHPQEKKEAADGQRRILGEKRESLRGGLGQELRKTLGLIFFLGVR